MFFNYLTLFSALFISGVAIFYSVAGLATIFAASAIPVIIMGTSLEVGKLVVAVWLHKNWKQAVWWLKTYLSIAVLVMMFITSMGIFGYLSKSHVEQTSASQENIAKIERLEADIARQKAIIARSEEKIIGYEKNGSGVDASIQGQIDKEQTRINSAYDRIQPQIDRQLEIIKNEESKINDRIKVYEQQVSDIDSLLTDLQIAITNNDIKKAQGIIGANPDGRYGPKTAERVDMFRSSQDKKRKEALSVIDRIRDNSSTISNAQKTIDNLNATVKQEIDESNALINRLRLKIGKSDSNNIGQLIDKEQLKITKANKLLDEITQEKFVFESQYRKLEAEVGPIKYIAEFVYGEDATKNILEEAVRWVILIIIFVFDPLAVLLLIASQYSFETEANKRKELKEIIHEEVVEEVDHVLHDDNTEEPDYNEESINNPDIIIESPDVTLTTENVEPYSNSLDGMMIGSNNHFREQMQSSVDETKDIVDTEIPDEPVIPEGENEDITTEEVDEPSPSITEIEELRHLTTNELEKLNKVNNIVRRYMKEHPNVPPKDVIHQIMESRKNS